MLFWTLFFLGLLLVLMTKYTPSLASLFASNRHLSHLQSQILTTRHQLSSTSAQDAFAQWAKLRRSLDALQKEHQTLATRQAQDFSFYTRLLKALNWILYLSILVYYWDAAVFYLPPDVLGPLTSWVAWPLAPLGSVGVFYGLGACMAVLQRIL